MANFQRFFPLYEFVVEVIYLIDKLRKLNITA